MTFNKVETVVLAAEWHRLACERGFYTGETSTDVIYALIMSELSEALEALRERRHYAAEQCEEPVCTADNKNAYEFEVADVYIRLLDAFGYFMKTGKVGVDALAPVNDEAVNGTRDVIRNAHNGMSRVQKLALLTRDVATCLYSLPEEPAVVASMIAVLVFADLEGIDLLPLCKAKQAYTVTRPYKHGNKVV